MPSRSKTAAVILAAGQGTRMRSKLPKVLHPLAGVPLVAHVVKNALEAGCAPVVVVVDANGRRVREVLAARFPGAPLIFATQEKALGTADAARAGLEAIPGHDGRVLILYGDVPLLRSETVERLQGAASDADVGILSAEVDDPSGYGRVVRNGDAVQGIVEEKDASTEQRRIREINVGVYLAEAELLRKVVARVGTKNMQREHYLTDIVEMAAAGRGAVAVTSDDHEEFMGINDREQLADAEAAWRRRAVRRFMDAGVSFEDPIGVWIGADVTIASDAVIGVGVQLRGVTRIAAGASIEGPSVLIDSSIGPSAVVHPFSHLEHADVGAGASVGPFARLRPETVLEENARVGNFVETKKTRLGKGAKANHLAYLGDANIGPDSNIGAGTITCNYDGANKHPTRMGRGVFIGSNSTLVAPLDLGDGAYVAAGSTITKDVPADALAFGRSRQTNRDGYAAHVRKRIRGNE